MLTLFMPSYLHMPEAIADDHDYVVSITRLRVRSPRVALSFFRRLGPVQAQMRDTPGLVAYGLRAQLLRMTFSTFGVFEDRHALAEFVRSTAHGEAMRALRGRLPSIESRIATTRGADLPLDWSAITARLETPDRQAPAARAL